MAIILSLETSAEVSSVALHDKGKLLAIAEVHVPQAHASKLAVLIEDIFKLTAVDKGQLQAVAVSYGPGSYTGLRIGTSTAKGICYALNLPLLAVSPLHSMTLQVQKFNFQKGLLCPMLDAKRMEVYHLLVSPEGNIVAPVQARVIEASSFAQELEQCPVLFFGPGASKCRETITHPNAHFIDDIFPSAVFMGSIAYDYFVSGKTEDLFNYEPVYLKEFVAKKSKPLIS